MRYSILLGIIFSSIFTIAQTPDFMWVKSTGNSEDGITMNLATDNMGNVYSVGSYIGTMDVDPGSGTTMITAIDEDMLLQKFNGNGDLMFYYTVASNDFYDRINDVTVDESGNIFITGLFTETVDFDPGPGVAEEIGQGLWSTFIVKLNLFGQFEWVKTLIGASTNYGTCIRTDSDGNIIIAGRFSGTLDFDSSTGTSELTTTYNDAYVLKMNSIGDFIWVKNFGGTSYEHPYGLSLDGANNIYVAGEVNGSTVDFDPGTGSSNYNIEGQTDMFVLSLDENGNYRWHFADGGSSYDVAKDIYTNEDGESFVIGNFWNEMVNEGITSVGYDDVIILRFDQNGNIIWHRTMGGAGSEDGLAIYADDKKNIYATGEFGWDIDLGAPNDTFYLDNQGSIDVFATKMDSVGNLIWGARIRGNNQERVVGIAADSFGRTYINGYYQNTVDFNPNPQSEYISSQGFTDSYILRLDSTIYGVIDDTRLEELFAPLGLYPNPALNVIHLNMQDQGQYFIFDVRGELLFSGELKFGVNDIQIEDLKAGTYLIEVRTELRIQRDQFIKHK
jgi:hypothetical protein